MTQTSKIDFKYISHTALSHSAILLKRWLPDGTQHGQEWVARNPTRNDRRPGSFKVNLRTGRWADFATGDAGGDLISLRAFLDGCSQNQAAGRIAEEIDL